MRICAVCPVRPECLRDAMEMAPDHDPYGVWGGTCQRDRDALTRANYPKGDNA
jgi:hypothetical protein